MKNTNLLKRTLTCIIGIPLLALIIFKTGTIGPKILITVVALLGSIEISKLLFSRITVLPLLSWLMIPAYLISKNLCDFVLALLIILSLAIEIKKGEKDDFNSSIANIGKNILSIVYPSYLLTFLIRFAELESLSQLLICYYLVLVFSNDIFAYIFGMLFGKSNNAGLKASPKKSYAGFIGGIVGSIAMSLLFSAIFSDKELIFSFGFCKILDPFVIAIVADIGDLAESVIKRSANVKDSSHLIPGHGGVLDRLDSIVATAPIFYILMKVFE